MYIFLFGIVIAVIVFLGVLLYIKNSQHTVPTVQHTIPTVQHAIPTVQHTIPTVQHTIPTVQHTIPTVQHTIPTVQHTIPTVQHTIPTVQHTVPTVQHVIPTTISRPFKIQSVATGLYYGDMGMTKKITDATVFNENSTHNLTTGGSEWAIKYAESNGKAMLTNDSGTAGYIINTQPKTGGGPALASSPFMSIQSVANALSSANYNTFQVVKVY